MDHRQLMYSPPEGWSVDPGLCNETAFLYPSWWNEVLDTWPSVCGLQAATYDEYFVQGLTCRPSV